MVQGNRAVQAYSPDNIHFPAAFYACLMLGVVAIPVALPVPLPGDELSGVDVLNTLPPLTLLFRLHISIDQLTFCTTHSPRML